MDANRYATKKTIAQGMLDIALLTANASQLKYILQVGQNHEFYTLMLILISVSIIMQVNIIFSFDPIGHLNSICCMKPFDFLFNPLTEQFKISPSIQFCEWKLIIIVFRLHAIDELASSPYKICFHGRIACNPSVFDIELLSILRLSLVYSFDFIITHAISCICRHSFSFEF